MSAPTLLQPTPIDGGWRVAETDRYWIDLLVITFGNHRVVITPKADPTGYERGWCYQQPAHVAALYAFTFDPDVGEEPEGWVKEVGTERRPCGRQFGVDGPHDGYVADCPDCGKKAR